MISSALSSVIWVKRVGILLMFVVCLTFSGPTEGAGVHQLCSFPFNYTDSKGKVISNVERCIEDFDSTSKETYYWCSLNSTASGATRRNCNLLPGKKCQFPFTFGKKTYEKCAFDKRHGYYWCSHEKNYKLGYTGWSRCKNLDEPGHDHDELLDIDIEGPDYQKPCLFPFEFTDQNGKHVATQQCVEAVRPVTNEIYYWCSMNSKSNATSQRNCRMSPDALCQFPFTYDNKTYESCALDSKHGYYWCSHEKTYTDGSDKWSKCASPDDQPSALAGKFHLAVDEVRHAISKWTTNLKRKFKNLTKYIKDKTSPQMFPRCHWPFVYNDEVYDTCIEEQDATNGLVSYWCSLDHIYIGRRMKCDSLPAEKCVPNFLYHGVTYETCHYSKEYDYYWCSHDKSFKPHRSAWSHCTNQTTGFIPLIGLDKKFLLRNGEKCHFPFIYEGKSYDTCIYDSSYKYYWCSHERVFMPRSTGWSICHEAKQIDKNVTKSKEYQSAVEEVFDLEDQTRSLDISGTCPQGGFSVSSSYFFILSKAENRARSRRSCSRYGARLAEVDEADKFNVIAEKIHEYHQKSVKKGSESICIPVSQKTMHCNVWLNIKNAHHIGYHQETGLTLKGKKEKPSSQNTNLNKYPGFYTEWTMSNDRIQKISVIPTATFMQMPQLCECIKS
jgi:hypothetical protein